MRALLLTAAAALGAAFPAAAQTVAVTNAKLVIGDGSAPVEGGTVPLTTGTSACASARVSSASLPRSLKLAGARA